MGLQEVDAAGVGDKHHVFKRSGEEHRLAGCEREGCAVGFHIHRSGQALQHDTTLEIFHRNFGRRSKRQAGEDEVRVFDQDADAVVRSGSHFGIGFQMAAAGGFVVFAVVDAVERFVEMHLAAGGWVEFPAPVVEAEGHVGGFLDLGDLQPAARCVDGAGRDEEAVARFGSIGVEQLLGGSFLAGLVECTGVGVFLEAHPDAGVRLRFQDVPELGLAVFSKPLGGDRVVRMDLHRQAVFHDQAFDQQGEIEIVPFENLVAHQVAQVGFQDIGKVVFSQIAFRDHGSGIFEAAEVPVFTAPGLRHPLGTKFEGIEFFHAGYRG